MTHPNGSAGIREVYQLVQDMERRLTERLDRLEDRMTTRTRWTVSTLVAAAALIMTGIGMLLR